MHTFNTPGPIRAVLDIGLGDVWIIADERGHTRVGAHPSDPGDPRDVATAERTRVEFADNRLLVMSPRPSGSRRTGGAVTVVIELPVGSSLRGRAAVADFRSEGRLGECRLISNCGHVWLDRTGALCLTTGFGDVTVEHASGDVEVTAHSGDLWVREIGGGALIGKPNGGVRIGEIAGDLRVRGADGPVLVGRAHAGVEVRTVLGDIRVDEAAHGPLHLDTTSGEIEIGLPGDVAPWLEVTSEAGDIYRSLDTFQAAAPAEGVKVWARTVAGNVVIRRSPTS
ncbi:DUF4097 family beta strand repeat-containing protein [Streptomyces rugosispiralis]|uniref:DUF4097 domain-containing protein n=1 Tax=Streptomyces rugosispiralis TaxID=2967341 RepID=A0ABT1UYT9_9ACTN|nr:DUF4097 family beta strand repeat-containing protein [Streptomyces rugosispiralis]MCQ8190287.1 DUF4097 domain-containing protein [Streptomyces rugosispiralis]